MPKQATTTAGKYDGSHPLTEIEKWPHRENEIQRILVRRARHLGWRISWKPRGYATSVDYGWPDLSMWRTNELGHRQILFIEVKTNVGKIKAAQQDCQASLRLAAPTYTIRLPRHAADAELALQQGSLPNPPGKNFPSRTSAAPAK